MGLDSDLNIFRAIGEETRLRIMALLVRGELTVSEITSILGQSQPRVSRHLKILADAGLAERHREGAWMFYRAANGRLNRDGLHSVLSAAKALSECDDRIISRDRERFEQCRDARAAQAASYFRANANDWNTLRQLHLPESDVEARMLAIFGKEPVDLFVDLGTGTGRMLELFSPYFNEGVGYDLSHEMLAIARSNLDKAGVDNAQVRHGDLFSLPLESGSVDVVCIHHVLHFLAEPADAVREAGRLLRPGGRLIVSDFAPHDLEFLRDAHAHRRLGFSDVEVADWCSAVGLSVTTTETLSPANPGKDKLTVKIWLCAAPAEIRQLPRRAATKQVEN